ncbi:MAG: PAS domain S-box protein [Candidatus Thorarchaeota archaeon]
MGEKELKNSENLFKAIYDDSPIGIELYNSYGKLIDLNQSCLELFGVSDKEDIIGFDLLNDPNIPKEHLIKLKKREAVRYESIFDFELVKKYNLYKTEKIGKIYIDVLITPIFLDNSKSISNYLVQIQDISERKEVEHKLVDLNEDLENRIQERTKLLRKSEEKLKKSKEKFTDITEQSLMGIAILQYDRLRYVNNQIASIFGYDPEEMKNWEKFGYAKLIHPNDREMVLEQERKKQVGLPDAVIHYQFRGITKQGKLKWLEIYSNSINYRDGIADLITIIDITAKKEGEKKLRETEEKYRRLVTNIKDTIFEIDLDGNITYLNPQINDMLGYKPEELIDQNVFNFVHPEDRDEVLKNQNHVINSGEIGSVEFRILHKEGHYLIVSSRGQLIEKDDKKRIVGLFRDITEHKKIEEKVRIEREKAEIYLNLVNVIIVALDRDGNISMINQKGNDILGWEKGKLIGKNWFDNCLPLKDKSRVHKYFKNLMKGKQYIVPLYENPVITKNGDEKLIAWSTILVRDSNGNITGLLSSGEDITERNKATQELRKFNERLKHLASSGPTVIYTAKASGNYGATFISENVKDLTGYEPENFIKNAEFWINNIHPDDRDIVLSKLSKIFKEKRIGYEYRFKFKSGIYHWIRDESKLIYDEKGNPLEMFGSWSDITWVKKSEEKLQYQAKLVENVSDAIISTDLAFKIITWNKAAELIYGWKAEEIIGKDVMKTITVEYPYDDPKTVTRQIFEEGFWKGEVIQPRKDGMLINILASISLIKDISGRPIGAVAINHDITERKKAEKKIKESEKKLKDLIEAVPIGISITSPKGKIEECNSSAFQIFGYDSKEELIKNPALNFYYNPSDRERFIKLLEKGLVKDFEIQFIKKDGSLFWGSLTSIIHKVEDQTNYINTFQDITKRKLAEIKIQESESELAAIYDYTPIAIILMDNERRIRKINKFALEMTGRDEKEIIGLYGGEALRCLYSIKDPLGCGFSEYCQECVIRNTVLDTLKSKSPYINVEATLYLLPDCEVDKIDLLFSTVPLNVGGEERVLISMIDISERISQSGDPYPCR